MKNAEKELKPTTIVTIALTKNKKGFNVKVIYEGEELSPLESVGVFEVAKDTFLKRNNK